MATVKDMLKCPKCRRQMMGKAHPQKFGKEYYAHCCREFFGVNELANQWGYDAADLYPYYPVTHANYKNWLVEPDITLTFSEFKVESLEPEWANGQERIEAYQMVNRMILGIPELDDYADQMNTYEDALGIGVQ